MTTKIAVLGCGRIGSMHAELIANRVDGAELGPVFDVFPEAASKAASQFGVNAAASIDEILDDASIDAVAICTSTDTHVDLIVAAARSGKAIFCEKPISQDLAEVDRALEVVADTGAYLQIGFNRRFDPSHRAVADAVKSGAVGDVHLVRITSRDPAPPPISYIKVSGGIFLDMTIHDFDMARYVTGSDVVEVHAVGAVRIDPAIGAAGDIDTAVVVMTHANGAITTIDNSRQAVYGYDQRVEVFGSAGMASSDNPQSTTTILSDSKGAHASPIPYFFLERYTTSYVNEWDEFLAALSSGSPSPVDGTDGRAPLLLGLAAWKSYNEGRPVKVTEVETS